MRVLLRSQCQPFGRYCHQLTRLWVCLRSLIVLREEGKGASRPGSPVEMASDLSPVMSVEKKGRRKSDGATADGEGSGVKGQNRNGNEKDGNGNGNEDGEAEEDNEEEQRAGSRAKDGLA